MAKKQAPLGSKEMAELLHPLADIIRLYLPVISSMPTKNAQQYSELAVLYNNLDASMKSLNNLVDMDDRTWEVEKVAINERGVI